MHKWKRGDLVELDGLLAVVVGVEGDPDIPEDHVAVWFGDPRCERKSHRWQAARSMDGTVGALRRSSIAGLEPLIPGGAASPGTRR